MNTRLGIAMALGLSVLAGGAQANSRKFLEGYDLNGDGGVSMSELVNIRTYNFNIVDSDGDGAINRKDILAAVKARKLPRSARRDESFMMSNDTNGDGTLTLAEFTDFTKLYAAVDADGDGLLQADEVDQSTPTLRKLGLIM